VSCTRNIKQHRYFSKEVSII